MMARIVFILLCLLLIACQPVADGAATVEQERSAGSSPGTSAERQEIPLIPTFPSADAPIEPTSLTAAEIELADTAGLRSYAITMRTASINAIETADSREEDSILATMAGGIDLEKQLLVLEGETVTASDGAEIAVTGGLYSDAEYSYLGRGEEWVKQQQSPYFWQGQEYYAEHYAQLRAELGELLGTQRMGESEYYVLSTVREDAPDQFTTTSHETRTWINTETGYIERVAVTLSRTMAMSGGRTRVMESTSELLFSDFNGELGLAIPAAARAAPIAE